MSDDKFRQVSHFEGTSGEMKEVTLDELLRVIRDAHSSFVESNADFNRRHLQLMQQLDGVRNIIREAFSSLPPGGWEGAEGIRQLLNTRSREFDESIRMLRETFDLAARQLAATEARLRSENPSSFQKPLKPDPLAELMEPRKAERRVPSIVDIKGPVARVSNIDAVLSGAKTGAASRPSEISIYISGDDGPKYAPELVSVVRSLLALQGLDMDLSEGPVIGSWWASFKAKAKSPEARQAVGERLEKVEQALEIANVGIPQANETLILMQGAAIALDQIRGIPQDVIMFVGETIVVRTSEQLVVQTLSPGQLRSFQRNSSLLNDAAAALTHLANLNRMAGEAIDRQIDARSAALGAQGPQGSQGIGL